jgi:hypothetical protein
MWAAWPADGGPVTGTVAVREWHVGRTADGDRQLSARTGTTIARGGVGHPPDERRVGTSSWRRPRSARHRCPVFRVIPTRRLDPGSAVCRGRARVLEWHQVGGLGAPAYLAGSLRESCVEDPRQRWPSGGTVAGRRYSPVTSWSASRRFLQALLWDATAGRATAGQATAGRASTAVSRGPESREGRSRSQPSSCWCRARNSCPGLAPSSSRSLRRMVS